MRRHRGEMELALEHRRACAPSRERRSAVCDGERRGPARARRRPRPRGVRAPLPPLRPVGLRARAAPPARPPPRRGRRAGDVRGGLALRGELQAGARTGGAVAVRRRPERDRRPACARRVEPTAELPETASAEPGPAEQRRVVVRLVARPPRARGAADERARGARARLLERPVAERGRRLPRHPARHREDADAQRARSPRRRCSRTSSHDAAAGLRRADRLRRRP